MTEQKQLYAVSAQLFKTCPSGGENDWRLLQAFIEADNESAARAKFGLQVLDAWPGYALLRVQAMSTPRPHEGPRLTLRMPKVDDPFVMANGERMYMMLAAVHATPYGACVSGQLRRDIIDFFDDAYSAGIDTIATAESGFAR